MAIIFDWREVEELDWMHRFDQVRERLGEGAEGILAWRETAWRIPTEDEKGATYPGAAAGIAIGQFRDRLQQDEPDRAKRWKSRKPCVFISHKRSDAPLAEKLARAIGKTKKYNVWLDVWDPNLKALAKLSRAGRLTPEQEAVAIAATIEMALVNSSRVLAVMTRNSAGSRWIPYEYGRVKEGISFGQDAAAWLDPTYNATTHLAEYMLLGPRLKTRAHLQSWL